MTGLEHPRNPAEVALKIKSMLPADVDAERLVFLAKDFYYKAPEQWPGCFRLLSEWVTNTVGQPPIRDEWKLQVVAELCELTIDEVQTQYGVQP